MTGVREMVIAARAGIENLAPADVAAELDRSWRDARRRPGTRRDRARLHPRGGAPCPAVVLEFRADPRAPHSTSTGSCPAVG